MAEKKTPKKSSPAKPNPNMIKVQDGQDGVAKDMTESQVMAAVVTRSGMTALTLKLFSGCGDAVELTDLIGEMKKAGEEVVGGNMGRIERMLVNQALTLDSIFSMMAQRAGKAEYMKNLEVYMRLAMKAQAQARSTAEALALLKNPQPYIRQANIANGPQQVNNGQLSEQYAQAHTGAGNLQPEQSKLLEADHGQRLDIGAQAAAGRANSHLETVGAVHRA